MARSVQPPASSQPDVPLRDRSAWFQDVFDCSGIGMALVAPDGRWLHVNAALCEILGYTPEELRARTFQDITHPDDLDADLGYVRRMLDGQIRTYQIEKRYVDPQGEIVWAQLTVSLVRDAAGVPEFFISQIQDITTRKRAEVALRQQAVVFETVGDAIIVMDLHGTVTDWNPAAERMFGWSRREIVGRSVVTIHHPDLGERLEAQIQASLRSAGGWAGELPFRRKDGSDGVADVVVAAQFGDDGRQIAWIGVNRDITERRRMDGELRQLEQQLQHSQKMEAVGQLAGGIAHDFNNLLTVIRTYSELLLDQIDQSNPLRGDLVEIQRAAGRAASLTRQLLAFSRKQLLQPKVLDLNGVVAGVEPMLRRLIGEDIRVDLQLGARLGRIKADPGQLEQVLVNLAVNARDAMPGGGSLTIATAHAELDDSYVGRHPVVIPGSYLMLAVTDTGTGMDAATRARIFEPFFTTKEIGKGTGLGLSTVYGIVKQSGGYIWVYSEPDQGATFKIFFPVIEEDVAPRVGESAAPTRGGSEVVLLVEDEDAVRALTRRLLERDGYTVLEARDGREALRVAAQYPQPIHIVVTDMVMPEMGGRQVFDALAAIRPDLRVLYTSGYTDDEIVRRGLLDTDAAFLQKPFTAASLGAAVRSVLDD